MTRYEIRVKENPTRDWTGWFGEMQVWPCEAEDQQRHTLYLTGELPDQSALLGVLMRLHNLNLTVLSVRRIDES